MGQSYFQFRQFTIAHDRCAMKVGTDGVLLGAWCAVEKKKRILDIGTGSGLIALMVAQRTEGCVWGIEIDPEAAAQAKENALQSPFRHRVIIEEVSLQTYAEREKLCFDAIVSNPPYFLDALRPPAQGRSQARHTDTLSYEELIALSASLLTPDGTLSIILPAASEQLFIERASQLSHLQLRRRTVVYPTPQSPPKRILLEMGPLLQSVSSTSLIIELERHRYSDEFRALTNKFYLQR